MKALLLGSISVLADTSEVQRAAFNQAFNEAGLDWYWSLDDYRAMLASSGGKDRLAGYAKARGVEIDVDVLHRHKTEIFQDALRAGRQRLRPLTAQAIEGALDEGATVAVVSGTDKGSVEALLTALGGADALGVKCVLSAADGLLAKPHPALFQEALLRLGVKASEAVAIEDNLAGVAAAKAAGIPTFVYPNENTQTHDFATTPHLRELSVAQAA
ncbi:MAG: HAD-IA family hydrolase [Pseudomonadota bacterium]